MCGIFGIYNNAKAAELATLGLFAEQHRGQESCGMAVNDGVSIKLRKKMGLVKDVFRINKLAQLQGNIAIGHVRYPTRGDSSEYNSQPHVVETLSGPSYTLTSNGDIVNYEELRKVLESKGVYFVSTNDGELILKYIVYQVEKKNKTILEAIKKLMKYVKGSYSSILATKNEMYIFRDPYGFRPLVYGELEQEETVAASESCALDILNPAWLKEVEPAEIIIVNEKGRTSYRNDPNQLRNSTNCRHCIFEHIYFSRPDSFIFGENVYAVRQNIGKKLAESCNLEADLVVPVPDSSNFIALGYARAKGIPYEMGLIRNHYVGRTFIKPEQTIRDESVRQKFNPLPNFFLNKRIILIDDSIVRGTTLKKLVKLIKKAGASEVHLLIGSPPVKHSCYYGIDTPTRTELIANNKNIAEIRQFIGADSLRYLTIDELSSTVKEPDEYCYACFNGNYPVTR
jgi:amidophosphoribosyltransferase